MSSTSGLRTLFDVPVRARAWIDSACFPASSPGCCGAAAYGDNPGDILAHEVTLIMSFTTDTATAAFADGNGDSCFRAGAGFPGNGPVMLTGATGSSCCHVGEGMTLVAAGVALSGAAPLFDYGFQLTLPGVKTSCGPPGPPASCVPTTDVCKGP
jgi:hypothetical protein